MPGGADPLTIGWNELIRPEQLVFGAQLGAGGSAQVFRGSCNGQEVAIKKISGVAHLDEMKKEINALRRLRHPRLVRFIGACLQPPLLLLVTEFMPGGSLHDRLFGSRRGGDQQLSPSQKQRISYQMAEGMAFLHSQKVVHRDMKSMNILIDAAQNAKICDFGLAQQMDAGAQTHIARKLDGEGGSPRYMAPECYDAAHGKLTEKVDVWAMGCILIELFGGVLPYADCNTMAQLSARILVERRPPDVPPAIPAQLARLISACVQFEMARRITASDLVKELGNLRSF
jgi:serine/threonine protein kinase